MATILGLALKINADASAVPAALTPVEKALQRLDQEAAKVTTVFENFARSSGAAADVQRRFEQEIQNLTQALQAGDINGQQFADGFAAIRAEASATADAFAEGARISEKYRTDQDRLGETTARLDRLLQVGAITQREYNAEMLEATGVNAQIARAERERADISARAARVLEANLTAGQRAQNAYNAEILEYQTLLRAGAISQDDFNRAVERSAASFAKATVEANKTGSAIDAAGKGSTLQFNELSGILSALPGPLGSVAGRFSGLASAGEGLSRVFAGGLSSGISGVGASVAAIVNPFTLAAAGVAGFGAAATAVASGLASLSGRVEQLGFAARQAGVDFQTIQVLDEAATRAGVGLEALATGVQRFGARLSDAARGTGETFNALQQLGFTLQEIQQGQNDPTEFAGRVARALEQIPEPARQAQLQIDILGRGGESLVRAFGELEGSATAIRRFGGAINDLDQQRLLALDGAFEDLQRSILGFGRELITPFIGVADSIADALSPAIAGLGRSLGTILDIISPITSLFGTLLNVVGQVAGVFLNVVATALEPFAASARAVSVAIDSISQTITAAFGPINDVVLAVQGFFSSTFSGVEETATRTATAVAQAGAAAVQNTEAQKRAYEEVQRAVEAGNRSLDSAIAKAGQFGQAGFDAAFQFQEALADLKEQADAKELNAEQYSRGVALATAEFDQQIERLQRIQDETRKAAEEAQRRVDADRQIVDALIEQARVNEQFGGDASRARAADAVLAAEREVARLQEQVAADRNAGNTEAAAAGEERIRQLTVIAQQQASIADGSAKAAADEARRVKDQKRRVDELIRASDTRSELEQQLIDVQEQQKITLDQLIIARRDFNVEQANAAAGRLAQLDQLQARLEDQQQAVEQGFGQGFAQAFQETDRGIDALIVKAQEFGNVGALAAEALEAGIAQAKAQARDGILTQETYEREIAQQRDIFEQRLQAAQRVEDFLRQGVDQRRQAELDAAKEIEERKRQAEINVQAIQAKLIEERKQLEELRERGDIRGARAAQNRVAALERAQRGEQALADGRIRQQQQFTQQFTAGVNQAQLSQQSLFASQQRSVSGIVNAGNAAIQASAEAFAIQARKIEELLTPTNALAQVADVRTAEGQALLVETAQRGQDPSLVEARFQSKQLQLIAQGIVAASQNYFNAPVSIVGGNLG